MYTCTIETPLGHIKTAAGNDMITGLWFIGQKYFPKEADSWQEKSDYAVFQYLRNWLKDYFAGKNPPVNIPLNPQGTPFQLSVWAELKNIPYSKTLTYGEIALQLNKKQAFQAVGGAVGHNPISILIPCHRVIGADKGLTGYAGGIERKRALLKLEGGLREMDF